MSYIEASNSKVYYDVENLESAAQWLDLYLREARRLKTARPFIGNTDAERILDEYCERAVSQRVAQLDAGGTKIVGRIITMTASIIPMGKTVAMPFSVQMFNRNSIRELGMADTTSIHELRIEADKKGGVPVTVPDFYTKIMDLAGKKVNKEIRNEVWMDEDIQEYLQQVLKDEFGEDAAEELIKEGVHIKPVVGQIYSMGRGWHKSGKKMNRSLAFLEKKAVQLHKKIFVGVAMLRIL